MISTEGLLTVVEAAKRLKLSTEQVRRKLREGKLKGQRIGNQWFIEEASLTSVETNLDEGWLISRDLLQRIDETREAIFRENGIVYDVVKMLRAQRDSH